MFCVLQKSQNGDTEILINVSMAISFSHPVENNLTQRSSLCLYKIPYFLSLAPLLGSAPRIRPQISISAPAQVSAPSLDKRLPLKISFDFD